MIRKIFSMLILGSALASALPGKADYIDSINPNAQIDTTWRFYPINDIGWYYNPSQSYTLNGIFSEFNPINFGTGVRTMTVQFWTDRPANGGSLLAQNSFQANSSAGGILGANFAPIQLTAGTSYFVDFVGIQGMGVDLGQWANVNGSDVAIAGATTRLAGFYDDNGDGNFGTAILGNNADENNNGHTASGLEPILFFSGFRPSAVPEPGSLNLLGMGVIGSVVWRRRGVH